MRPFGSNLWRRVASWRKRPRNWGDALFYALCLALSLSILGLALLIVLNLVWLSLPSLKEFGIRFLASANWDPYREDFGALATIYGTLVTSAIALVIAIPVSLGIAIFLAEVAPPWLRSPASFLVEMLAAIPSVVYGLWGLFVLVPIVRSTLQTWLGEALGFIPLFQGPPFGVGFLTGGLILAIMVIPIITAISRDSLRAVPSSQREAMLALGATPWETISRVVIPHARSGIVGASILGLGRALGETMAVTMVIGNSYKLTPSLFSPGQTMASAIASEFNEATSDLYIAALVETGLILFAITLVVNILARWLIRRGGPLPRER